ncbi:MAG TPA: carboxypeptidase regulatory-like domain-containing protein, partial [Blastocatellia bacterium]|nr:carboxypeptidase regulatory-like domain-containing protein [Blastocatellia bacterium]
MLGRLEPDLFRSRFILRVVALLFLVSIAAQVGHSGESGLIRIIAQDEANNPVPGVTIQVKRNNEIVSATATNEKGEAVAANLSPGQYEIIVSKEGFETRAQQGVTLAEAAIEVKITLVPKIALSDKVDISASASAAVTPEQTASVATELQAAQVRNLPSKPTTVSDTLPLVPGVIRSPQGEIKISGSSENRSAFIVNSADVTDPATGQFGMTVPVDSVQTINVFKTPYLAQYGRFSAGVVSVETKRGGEKWNFELNDPLPEFRYLGGNLRGLRDATPRVVFNGPLLKNRLYISQGTEYAIRKRPVQTLEYPNKETKSESVNSFTQLDYLLSGTHTLTGTFHLAPRKDSFIGLDFFNRRPVTPNWRGKDYTGTLIDRLTLGQNLLESTVSVKNYTVNVYGQGAADMNLTPTANTGNYFSWQDREARRAEFMETLSLKPILSLGAHNLKFGSIIARTSNRGQFIARPVNIFDEQGTPLRRIEFSGGSPFDLTDLETHFFGQDHWVVTPRLAFDYGLRFERQGITDTFRLAPRAGLAWTPFENQKTVFRSGYGIFYDRVPLSVYAFDKYPEQVMTIFAPDGSVLDGPRRYFNITDKAEIGKNPFIGGGSNAGNFAPYSGTWNAEVEHTFAPWLRLRGSYLNSSSSGVMVINPKVVQGQDALVLGGGGRSRYRQFELVGKMMFDEGKQQLFLSYVNSRSRSDVNEFNTYIGNFPFPIVRLNQFARGSADMPNRFLGWGLFNLPWKTRLAPIVEYRNGLPFSMIDSGQAFVGEVNSKRFPNFFSLDSRLSKDFQVSLKYALRFSLSGFNLTNHFNALDTHRNTADPESGVFFGNSQRRFRLDF